MFKLALNAGHSYLTTGKRCLKSIDQNETREYVLNKRVCDKIQNILSEYDGIKLLRIDDGSEIPLRQRTDKANDFLADFYLSIHHNAGIYGGTGGGIEAYVYPKVDNTTLSWQKDLYQELIKQTTLKGNRATPLKSADFAELRDTKMPAVLLELGFMDSRTDTPVILNEAFADKAATACAQVIVKKAKLTKKPQKKSPEEIAKEVIKGLWGNGQDRKNRLTKAGYNYKEIQEKVNELLR